MKEIVTTHHLVLNSNCKFVPFHQYKDVIRVEETNKNPFLSWSLFVGVGMAWRWYSRLNWSFDQWALHVDNPEVKQFLAFNDKRLVGFFELNKLTNSRVEIKFIGLFPNCIGNGFGGALLSHAIEQAFLFGASVVVVHTCTSDHPSALKNYINRGFVIDKTITEEENIPDLEETSKLINLFLFSLRV